MKRFDAIQNGSTFEYRGQLYVKVPAFSTIDGIFNAVQVGNTAATALMFFFGHDLVTAWYF